jgi:hypothetical protein
MIKNQTFEGSVSAFGLADPIMWRDRDNFIGCDMNEFWLCATSPLSTQSHPSGCSDQRRWSPSKPLPQLSSITFTVWPLGVLSLITFFMASSNYMGNSEVVPK